MATGEGGRSGGVGVLSTPEGPATGAERSSAYVYLGTNGYSPVSASGTRYAGRGRGLGLRSGGTSTKTVFFGAEGLGLAFDEGPTK